jgi:hypothetical protein
VTPREIAEALLDRLRDAELLIEQLSEEEVHEFFAELYDPDPAGVPEVYVEAQRAHRERWRAAFDAEMDRAYEGVRRAKRAAEEALLATSWQLPPANQEMDDAVPASL